MMFVKPHSTRSQGSENPMNPAGGPFKAHFRKSSLTDRAVTFWTSLTQWGVEPESVSRFKKARDKFVDNRFIHGHCSTCGCRHPPAP